MVAETWDGHLNDINGFHVRPEHAGAALGRAKSGVVAEGGVGGGTGMVCFEFKCGIGTASRIVGVNDASYTLGILVQANFGRRGDLRVAGIPVGERLPGNPVYSNTGYNEEMLSSIIVVIATDAPLLPHQLKRLARRAPLGLGVTGSTAHNGSGDIFIAFSTANPEAGRGDADAIIRSLPNDDLDGLFAATKQATEEAIMNALVAGRDMTGDHGHIVQGIDRQALQEILREHKLLQE